MKRKNDVDSLLTVVRSALPLIEKNLESSLNDKMISGDLRVGIKNFLENSRSILDYIAHDIAEVLEIKSEKVYFPIVTGADKGKTSFVGYIGRHLPGLDKKNLDLFNFLETLQSYNGDDWLENLGILTNDTKHNKLVPVERLETQRVKSTHSRGSSVSWNPQAVTFGSGVLINGAPVNPATQLPIDVPEVTLSKEIWVDITFDNGKSVFPFLNKVINGLDEVVTQSYRLLEE